MPSFHFILAIVWSVVGVTILALQMIGGDPRGRIPVLGNLSVGWVALLLGGYNLVRWYGARAALRDRRLAREEEARRREMYRKGRESREEESGFRLENEPLPPEWPGEEPRPGGEGPPSENGSRPAP